MATSNAGGYGRMNGGCGAWRREAGATRSKAAISSRTRLLPVVYLFVRYPSPFCRALVTAPMDRKHCHQPQEHLLADQSIAPLRTHLAIGYHSKRLCIHRRVALYRASNARLLRTERAALPAAFYFAADSSRIAFNSAAHGAVHSDILSFCYVNIFFANSSTPTASKHIHHSIRHSAHAGTHCTRHLGKDGLASSNVFGGCVSY